MKAIGVLLWTMGIALALVLDGSGGEVAAVVGLDYRA